MAGSHDLVIQGDDEVNTLTVNVVHEDNSGLSIYNVIHAAGGDDVLSGRATVDYDIIYEFGTQLFGEDGNDTIYDMSGVDTLSGGAGDDIIYYTGGQDHIDGGDDFDILVIDTYYPTLGQFKSTGIEEFLVPVGDIHVGNFDMSSISVMGPNEKKFSRDLFFSKRADIANVTFIGTHEWSLNGSKFGDFIDVSTSSVKFGLSGEVGNDTLIGGSGADKISGALGNDLLSGGEGNDTLFGENGGDTLLGGDGDDFIYTSIGNDVVHGGNGNDVISAKQGPHGGWATRLHDYKIIDGGAGDDVFRDFRVYRGIAGEFSGGEGTDKIVLGNDISGLILKGIEVLSIVHGAQSITADADVFDSFDKITGIHVQHFTFNLSSGGHFTWDSASQEPHTGTINGSTQTDYIDMSASLGVWTILGGDGDDTLKAGRGYTGLSGQGGRDTFVFDDHSGRTEIIDYDHAGIDGDIIDLSAVTTIKDFKDMIAHHVSSSGNFLTIDIGKGDIEFYHLKADDLSARNFVFH